MLLKAGRLLPKERVGLMAFAEAMVRKDAPTLEFADAGGEKVRTSPLDYVLKMLEDRPPVVHFGEIAVSQDLTSSKQRLVAIPKGWGADKEGLETLQRIQEYMAQNNCDYTTAMLAVCGGGRPARRMTAAPRAAGAAHMTYYRAAPSMPIKLTIA